MEINAANVARHKICFVDKNMNKKKFGELSTEEMQENKNKSHKVRNENIQRYVSIKFPLKVVKFQT